MARRDGNLVKALYVLMALAAAAVWMFIGAMAALQMRG